ncbi:Alpha-humulene synthase [Dichanthelium oligosanthes]|uniref:Alpha-humulene synthase n=1 Tax=Dichanthelium oligosanthes TaxID=888268 RepID=A0A1E5WKK1_9POAL|nr:Alpha-humulene synthase [Dichanthelium oligosanthes]
MFVADEAMTLADTVSLVDTLERLGIDNHFHEEIDASLSRIHSEEQGFDSSNDLHIVALRFCQLRQHGFWTSTDVFDKFKDGMGSFNTDLSSDPRGLLSLYSAAHMAVPGEMILDDAVTFARHHLEAAKGKLRSPMAEQVCRALKIPRPRFMRRLETMHYIAEYEQEEKHNTTILELARLDFNLVRSLHLKELRDLSLWWRYLYDDVKLTYSRDHWMKNMVSVLPEYLHMLYIKILSNFNEIEDTLEPYEKYRMAYIRKMVKLQSKSYFEEAKWFDENYTPSFKEHVEIRGMDEKRADELKGKVRQMFDAGKAMSG